MKYSNQIKRIIKATDTDMVESYIDKACENEKIFILIELQKIYYNKIYDKCYTIKNNIKRAIDIMEY